MGTRRSKHNKGVKPLYKEHHFNLIEDASHQDRPAYDFAERMKREAAAHATLLNRRNYAPKPNVELEERVARYLAGRVNTIANASNIATANNPEAVPLVSFDSTLNSLKIENRDWILRLLLAKIITGRQFRAARKWQFDYELASIQPNVTIDWSRSVKNMGYQARGDLSDSQGDAMDRRNAFTRQAGTITASFLDICLEPMADRAMLMRKFGLTAPQLHLAMSIALTDYCVYLGTDMKVSYSTPEIRSWRAA